MNQAETDQNQISLSGNGSPNEPSTLATRGGQETGSHSEQIESPGQQAVPDAERDVRDVAILPVRSIVIFPGMVVPLTIGRPSALKLIDSELPENKYLGLATQRDEQTDRPGQAHFFS